MRTKLLNLLIVASLSSLPLTNSAATNSSDWKTYRNERYHVEFIYPAHWVYQSCISGYKNGEDLLCVGFQSKPFKQAHQQDYDILFELKPLSLESALEDDLSFEKNGNKWIKHSRGELVNTKDISSTNWQGLYASLVCNQAKVSYAAGECLTAFLSQKNITVIFATSTQEASDIVLQHVIPSFTFH